MKKTFTTLFTLILISSSMLIYAQQGSGSKPSANNNEAVMIFDKLEYNFGTIKQGDVVSYDYKFKNIGKEPLIINNATASCGCTVADYTKEPLKPNATSSIKVTFDSKGKLNMQDKTITITDNTDKLIILHMKGKVVAAAAID